MDIADHRTRDTVQPPETTAAEWQRMGAAIAWLAKHYTRQPTLEAAAAAAGLSAHHFQRLFTRHVGVSPKKFIQHLTLDHAKRLLADQASVLDAALDAGLSGPSRLHDLFVTHEALTPGEWKARAGGMTLFYGWHPSPFGDALVIASPRGLCGLAFATATGHEAALDDLARDFGRARLRRDAGRTREYAAALFDAGGGSVHLVLRATPFRLQVWRALMRLPAGAVVSYGGLAKGLGRPGADRAVAGAVAANTISWLIPCHRVIRANGSITGYRWGPEVKRAMLALEAARNEGPPATARGGASRFPFTGARV